jgi:pimeloyl-ACP methyl ester carboxylesterase
VSLDFLDPRLSCKVGPTLATTPLGVVEYVDFGAGPVIVTVHGAMGGYDQSLILAQTIGGAGFRYIGISRPGYLGTPLASGRSPEQQGDLIAALLDALGVDRAGVFAVSGGGPSALFFALRHPGRCKGLVLVSTCATCSVQSIPLSFRIMTRLARVPWIANRFGKKASRDLKASAARSIQDPAVLERTVNDAETWPLFSTMMLSTFDRMWLRLDGTANDIRISGVTTYDLENVAAPVLIIHGTADRLVDFATHAKLHERMIKNVELVVVEGGEHVSIFTHRGFVRPRVAEFAGRYLRD